MQNFIQIGQKTQKLETFTFGRFLLVRLEGQKMVVGISKSFYVVFAPLLAHIPNFIQIGQKKEVKMISYRLASVGWSGQSKNSCIHFKLILFCF